MAVEIFEEYDLAICREVSKDDQIVGPAPAGAVCGICGGPATTLVRCKSYVPGTIRPDLIPDAQKPEAEAAG